MIEKSALFCLGALGYGCIELAARGYTHWTMVVLGGLCLAGLYRLDLALARLPLLVRAAAGAAAPVSSRAWDSVPRRAASRMRRAAGSNAGRSKGFTTGHLLFPALSGISESFFPF